MKRSSTASSGSPNNAETTKVNSMASKNIKAIKNTKAKINDKSKINTKANINTEAKTKIKKHKTNWHEAAVCALKIDLRDYADLLNFQTEYVIGKNYYRLDLVIIKKLTERPILKTIAKNFKKFNIFEVKGIGSAAGINAYIKATAYALLYIEQAGRKDKKQYSTIDATVTLLSYHYPKKLINHLIKEADTPVEKLSDGIYIVKNGFIYTQLIVTKELPPEDYLYLRCLTDELTDEILINRLSKDFNEHQKEEDYIKYINQVTGANKSRKGESLMICEGVLNLFGTSSEEIRRKEAEYYLPQIDELKADNKKLALSNKQLNSSNKKLTSSNKQLISSNNLLTKQVNQLKQLLIQNNIAFELDGALDEEN